MHSKGQLLVRMVLKGLLGFALLGIPLFGGAGTFRYPNAWVLMLSLCLWMLLMGVLLLLRYPETLEKRLKARENEKAQKGYVVLIGLLFIASFALAGLDRRFGWSGMPFQISAAAWVVMLLGYVLYCAVVLQNSYASRVVEIQKNQVVIQTGLYALVRHPMYFATLLLFLAMPLVLGSYIALIPMLLFPIALVLRIRNEEAVLMSGLEGYTAYVKQTRYRLIPFVW